MSVLIRGIEMPTSCRVCFAMYSGLASDYCRILNQFMSFDSTAGKLENCPLIEITSHGRLIDADALKSDMEECKGENAMAIYATGYARSFIDNAPTVIPADKDGGT